MSNWKIQLSLFLNYFVFAILLNSVDTVKTSKMTEKYDVWNNDGEASGGEYPNQDGFGWTNGVFLALMS